MIFLRERIYCRVHYLSNTILHDLRNSLNPSASIKKLPNRSSPGWVETSGRVVVVVCGTCGADLCFDRFNELKWILGGLHSSQECVDQSVDIWEIEQSAWD